MPPPTKRRRLGPVSVSAVEEVNFDPSARQEYLTGFHKRKLARAKHARELAEKKEREERLKERRRLREGRKDELQRHVEEVNASIRGFVEEERRDGRQARDEEWESEDDGGNAVDEAGDVEAEKEGIEEVAVDHEDEYIDEDKFTTVLVEEVDVDRDGLHKTKSHDMVETKQDTDNNVDVNGGEEKDRSDVRNAERKRQWTKEKPRDGKSKPKQKRKKFRYENKAERKFTREKERSKNRKQASARRKGE